MASSRYSLEAIRKDAKFSFQSDVWSYGVTLFEMFSRGESPNLDPDRELSQDEFLQRLESGDRLVTFLSSLENKKREFTLY